MKLSKLHENIIIDEKEIRDYLHSMGYRGGFSITSNGDVDLDDDVYFSYITHKNKFPNFKINICQSFKYYKCDLDDDTMLPVNCSSLKIADCTIKPLNDYVVNTTAIEYSFDNSVIRSGVIINNTSLYSGVEVILHDTGIKKLIYNSPGERVKITINKCQNIVDFSNIVSNTSVAYCEIKNVGIRNFNNFDIELKNYLCISSKSFENYLLIDNIKANVLDLYVHDSFKNIITLVMNKHIRKIDVFVSHSVDKSSKTHDVVKILDYYVSINQAERSEHVMDCAVELIDIGCEEAAEL